MTLRHRLRFLLQEFDLPLGVTLLGRSAECHITIEDPLVSRTHARIDRTATTVTVRDEGSRNGVRVNGTLLEGPQVLSHGDRIRIGTQELVFSQVELGERTGKTTGFLRHCANCRLPYPEEAGACPSCGATGWAEDDTITGKQENARTWRLELYTELLNRSLSLGRTEELEGMWLRATAEVDERLGTQQPIERKHLVAFCAVTLDVAVRTKNVTCACWAIRLFRRAAFLPDATMLDHILPALELFPLEVADTLREASAYFRQSDLPEAGIWAHEFEALSNTMPVNAPSDNPTDQSH